MSAAHNDFQKRQHELFAGYPQSWHDAIDAGHDMALVAEAMERTFEERMNDLQRALDSARRLREGMRRERPGHDGPHQTSHR